MFVTVTVFVTVPETVVVVVTTVLVTTVVDGELVLVELELSVEVFPLQSPLITAIVLPSPLLKDTFKGPFLQLFISACQGPLVVHAVVEAPQISVWMPPSMLTSVGGHPLQEVGVTVTVYGLDVTTKCRTADLSAKVVGQLPSLEVMLTV